MVITLRTPDRNGSPVSFHFAFFIRKNPAVFAFANDVKLPHRSGAGEARGAHNPEVVGSNPTSGILSLRLFYIVLPHNPPASSWDLQKPAVQLDVKRSLRFDIHRYSSDSEGREIDTHCHLRLPCISPTPSPHSFTSPVAQRQSV